MKLHEYEKMHRTETTFWWFAGKGRLIEDWATRWFETDGEHLDAGCGTGASLSRLINVGKWWGLDAEAEALKFSAGRGMSRLIQGDVLRLPFSDASFDGALALDLLEHLADDHGAARELHRVLLPGGRVLVTVPAYPWLFGAHDRALGHHRRYRREDLVGLLSGAGFRIVRVSHFMGLIFPLFLAVRVFQKYFGDPADTVSYDWPGCLNRIFLSILDIETAWLKRWNMPMGATLVAVAEKPLG